MYQQGDWERRGRGFLYLYRGWSLELERHYQEILARKVEYVDPQFRVPYRMLWLAAQAEGEYLGPYMDSSSIPPFHPLLYLWSISQYRDITLPAVVVGAWEEVRDLLS